MMENDNVKYEDYWVAYFDILGFENLVRYSDINDLRNKYKIVLYPIKNKRLGVYSKWFSDTFVLYKKDDSKSSFWNISCASQLFFRGMFMQWIPMRGCLNFGKFYVDEEKDIFFGTSLIDAYKLAKNQNWIGFVLSQNVKAKLEECDIHRGNFEQCYCGYDVPCEQAKCNLLAYNLKLCSARLLTKEEKDKEARDLWDSLIRMERYAKNFTDTYNERVIAKYKNTKNYLFEVFPVLKKNIEDRNSYFPKKGS